MPVFLLTGMLTTKDPVRFFEAFAGLVERVVTVPLADSEASYDPAELAGLASVAGLTAESANSLEQGLSAINRARGDRPARIVIAGSLYLVGETLRANDTLPE